jgi:Domain of unknown function (DUF4878)
VLVGLALIGCGGDGDSGDPEQTVRDFVTAINERDGDRLCGELFTSDYMERATGATGDEAEEACKQQLDLVKGLRVKLVSLGEARVDGERARVRAVVATGGRRTPETFSLVEEDGRWKLVGGSAER